MEREILPMCRAEGMGVAPWGALGSGNFKTSAELEKKEKELKEHEGRKMAPPSEEQKAVSKVLERIAERKGSAITGVALAYVMHKVPYVFPIVGGRKIEHLKGNIEALGLVLEDSEMEEIEDAAPFDPGFPLNFLSHRKGGAKGPGDLWLTETAGHFDFVLPERAIRPKQNE
jgi:aryl-alcohol dehydrogenase-like predicted oxidoreductase